jgi:hypothetical protein
LLVGYDEEHDALSPAPPAAVAYWSSGGAIVGGGRSLSREAALARLAFYRQTATACRRAGDRDGADFCARRSRQLVGAIRAANAWRRAAGDFHPGWQSSPDR